MIMVDRKDYVSKQRHEPLDLCNEEAIFCEVGTWILNVVLKIFELHLVKRISNNTSAVCLYTETWQFASGASDFSMSVPTAVMYI
jgi:hypothetical protein